MALETIRLANAAPIAPMSAERDSNPRITALQAAPLDHSGIRAGGGPTVAAGLGDDGRIAPPKGADPAVWWEAGILARRTLS